VFTAAVVAVFFAMIYARISLDRTAFVLDDLETQISIEEARHWDLRTEAARLQAPERITARAASLGLVYPEEVITIEVEGFGVDESDPEYRWAELRALLSAQP